MHVPETEITVLHAGVELVRVTLPPGEYTIGRASEAHIRADTALLSRRHAQITINYDQILLEDLGSSNGTFVNDQPVTAPTRLFPNQKIRLGPDITLEVHRKRAPTQPGVSLAPGVATARRVLPDEVLAEKRYAIGNMIAQGGMGAILDAQQAAMKRRVAMKVMLDSAEPADVLRFVSEAQVTGQLEHPSIVPVYELGVDEQDQLFYTMKFVRGITLHKVLSLIAQGVDATAKKYPLPVLLTIFQKVCDAMAFAHSKGVIHRDLKPENIMLGDFGEVLVMDWGLAKVLGKPETLGAFTPRSKVFDARSAEGAGSYTMAGSVMGTPAYMSPEQARGEVERLDGRSDIYALGTILFEILQLRPAVSGTDAWAIVGRVSRGEVEWTSPGANPGRNRKEIPASLGAVLRKALAAEASARYLRVEDLQADLLAYQNGFATSAEKAGAWKQLTLLVKRNKAASLGLAAVLLVGSVLGTNAINQGRRAERALADLKKTAPALRQFSEMEENFQHFDTALLKLDAAISIDPDERSAYWRRAWILLGLEDYVGAATALRTAQKKDSAHPEWAKILPVVEELGKTSESERWTPERVQAIKRLLAEVRGAGELGALAAKLRLRTEENAKLVRTRLDEWVGKDKGTVQITEAGLIEVSDLDPAVSSLEPLHGLAINSLHLANTAVTDLGPLRGMPLIWIEISRTKIASLEPLKEMRLTSFKAWDCHLITDWSPLRGMPLKDVTIYGSSINELSFLAGAPLERLDCSYTRVSDISPIKAAPLVSLWVASCPIGNFDKIDASHLDELWIDDCSLRIAPLRGKLLRKLIVSGNACDCSQFLDLPKLEFLSVDRSQDGLEALKQHPSLRSIELVKILQAPVPAFWERYGALVADWKQNGQEKLKSILAAANKTEGGAQILDLNELHLENIDVLKGLKLAELSIRFNRITDLSPLRGMPLKKLFLLGNPVSDLSPLRGLPLETLVCDRTLVTDLRPLLDMPALRNIMIPREATNIGLLRSLKNLESIGWEYDWAPDNDEHSSLTAAEFWKRYDELKAKGEVK